MSNTKNLWDFTLPRYNEIPDVGLYLKQVVKLIGDVVEPYFGLKVSDTMLSNYVKMHLISSPVKKVYDRKQIASLLFIVLAKSVVSLENIQTMLMLQEESHNPQDAYNYFCDEFEKALLFVNEKGQGPEPIVESENPNKRLLARVIITMAHKYSLDYTFAKLNQKDEA